MCTSFPASTLFNRLLLKASLFLPSVSFFSTITSLALLSESCSEADRTWNKRDDSRISPPPPRNRIPIPLPSSPECSLVSSHKRRTYRFRKLQCRLLSPGPVSSCSYRGFELFFKSIMGNNPQDLHFLRLDLGDHSLASHSVLTTITPRKGFFFKN